jgi:hypothetical protein
MAFGLTDLIEGKTLIHTGFQSANPVTNISDDRPNKWAVAIADNYEIDSSNDTLPFNEGGGQFNVVLTHGRYNSTNLGAHIGALMTAHPSTTLTYTVQRGGAGRWQFDANGSFELEWDDDAVSAALARELGHDTTSTGLAINHTGSEARWSTSSLIVVDFGAATAIEIILLYLASTDPSATFNNVTGYLHSSYLGDYRAPWVAGASETLTISNRSTTQTDNQIQFALRSTAATDYRYLCVSWRHFDTSQVHAWGLLKAFAVTYDSTNGRTITPLRQAVPLPSGPGITQDNMFPVSGIPEWGADLRFEAWEVASWRAVGHAAIRHGNKRPLFWILDYTGNLSSGADDLALLTDYGQALWASIASVGTDNTVGQQDAYITNRIRLRQVPS